MKIARFILMSVIAALAITACSPNDDHSLGESNITQDSFTFTIVPGSDEWTYNYTISFNSDPSIYACTIDFGDGASAQGASTGSHEYLARAGSFTAKCTLSLPTGASFVKEQTVSIASNNPKLLEDPVELAQTWVVDENNKHVDEVRNATGRNIGGHIGLGPINSYSQQDWAAGAQNKAGWKLYDWRVTFNDGKLTIVTGGEGYGWVTFNGQQGFTYTRLEGSDMIFPYNGGEYTYVIVKNEPYPKLILSGNAFLGYYLGTQEYEIVYLSETALAVASHNKIDNQDWVVVFTPEGQE